MAKYTAHKLVLSLTLLALTMHAGRAFAQSTTTTPSGSTPAPSSVTGTDPEPQSVTGSDPEPQSVTGTDPEPQSTTLLMMLQVLQLS
jgi:hypothetical protein